MTNIQETYTVLIEVKIFISSSPVKILCRTKKLIVKDIIGNQLPISVRWPADGHPLPQGKYCEKLLNLTDLQIVIQIIYVILPITKSFKIV